MKTLIVDGQWFLKKNFYSKKATRSSNGDLCGGVIGFIYGLKDMINRVIPDRVVVAWDGFNAGKFRYDIYPAYKSNRGKNWEAEETMLANEGLTTDAKEKEKFEIFRQKLVIKNILEELFVRQMEVKYIEADDLIAQYVLKSEEDKEEIYIYSRDGDFYQLISEKVSVITPDYFGTLNKKAFEEHFNHTLQNELLFKCFKGDDADKIEGVKGINKRILLENFPAMANEKYTFKRLVDECYEAKKDKKKAKKKIFDKIIGSHDVLYRNAKLMDLRRPFLNLEAKDLVEVVKHGTMESDRDITSAMAMFMKAGLMEFVGDGYLETFLSPFYMIMSKEKEFANKMKL